MAVLILFRKVKISYRQFSQNWNPDSFLWRQSRLEKERSDNQQENDQSWPALLNKEIWQGYHLLTKDKEMFDVEQMGV